MAIKTWMIYGAYGYSGRLIANLAKKQGLTPVLAGRNAEKTKSVAEELGFEWCTFDLNDHENVVKNLNGIDAVVHCAGPFSSTSRPMLEACLDVKAHYFDITGEMAVFEFAHSSAINQQAINANVIVCPGIGFDVIPTDCIAKALSEAMPDATHLSLGFAGSMALSPGTAKSMVESLAQGTKARRNGVIQDIKLATRDIDYDNGKGPRQSMTVSWGDVSTAFYTTGIKNIEVYWPASNSTIRQSKIAGYLRPLFKLSVVQNFLKARVDKSVKGPNQNKRAASKVAVWGEVRNAKDEVKTAYVKTQNGYDVTATGPIAIIKHLLTNDVPNGSITPSLLMGKDFVSRLPESTKISIR